MADIEITPFFVSTQPNDPLKPEEVNRDAWNAPRKIAAPGAAEGELMQIDSASDTGGSTTTRPRVQALKFTMTTDPASLANGEVTFVDVGGSFKLVGRRLDGSLIEIELG